MTDKIVYKIVNGLGQEVGEISFPFLEIDSSLEDENKHLKKTLEILKERLNYVERAFDERT